MNDIVENEDVESGNKPEKANHVNDMKTGHKDPFTEAFNKAQDKISEPEKEDTPAKPKKKEQPEAPKKESKKPVVEDDDEGEVESGSEKNSEDKAKPEKQVKAKEPPSWWSNARKEAFKFQPKHVQEQMLKEPPAPDQRWTAEQKEAFAKLPDEGKVIILERSKEIERGYSEKFESLANERKLAEDVKRSISPVIRDFMTRNNINEGQAVQKLFQLQQQAMTDPIGYVKGFLARANIAVTDLYELAEDGKPRIKGNAQNTQNIQQQQADIRSHPQVAAMAQELQALRAQQAELQKQQAQQGRAEFEGLLDEKDSEGNSLYPFIRLLADPMASILESNADLFAGLSLKERLSAAYHQALESFPELASIQMSTKQTELDEEEVENVEPDEEEKRIKKLEKAKAPKSKSPQTGAGKRATDPLEEAIQSAQKQLKSKR